MRVRMDASAAFARSRLHRDPISAPAPEFTGSQAHARRKLIARPNLTSSHGVYLCSSRSRSISRVIQVACAESVHGALRFMFHEPSLVPRADITRPFLPFGDAQAVCHRVHGSSSERASVGLQIETVTLFPPCSFHQGCNGQDVGRTAEEPRDRCTNLQNQADASKRLSS